MISQPKAYYRYDDSLEPDHWFDAVQVTYLTLSFCSFSHAFQKLVSLSKPVRWSNGICNGRVLPSMFNLLRRVFRSWLRAWPHYPSSSISNALLINVTVRSVFFFISCKILLQTVYLLYVAHLSYLSHHDTLQVWPNSWARDTHTKKTAVRMGLELSVVNCLVDCSVLVLSTVHSLGTLHVPQSKTFQIAGASDWNSLFTELRKTTSIGSFKFNLFNQNWGTVILVIIYLQYN